MSKPANRLLKLLRDSKPLSELTEEFEPVLQQVITFVNCQSHISYREYEYTQKPGNSFYWCFLFQLFTLIENTKNQQLLTKVIQCTKPSFEGLINLKCV